MGSTWSVTLDHLPVDTSAEQATAMLQAVFDRVDRMMSTYKPESELSRFNQSRSTDWQAVPDELALVVAKAQRVSAETGGAFDVTVGPLVNLWGFGPEHSSGSFGTVPSAARIAEARSHVGYQKLHVRATPPALRKDDPAMYVDLSGIAKGYGADAAAALLDRLGAGDYLVEAGGELRAKGRSPAGHAWRIGIETPTPKVHRVLQRVALSDRSIATSGDYRNFFDTPERRYSHEIDPTTGMPVADAPASASVLAQTCARADALATAMMVLGPDRGLPIAERLHVPVLFVQRREARFEIRATPDFQALLVNPSAQTLPAQ